MVVWKKIFFCPLQFVYIRTIVFIVYGWCKSEKNPYHCYVARIGGVSRSGYGGFIKKFLLTTIRIYTNFGI